MSQVLQCTQFCALIWNRRAAALVLDDLVDAGRAIALRRLVVERQVVRDRHVGVLQLQVAGWSSSWLVFDRNTEDSRSKVSTPSGLG
jgi:hypothetical protein